jgi:hypothetical protein
MKLWQKTEGDEEYGYGYLEGEWEKGKHRKYTAFLTRKQFERFVGHLCLRAEDVETGGSLTGMGLQPAISFNGDDYSALLNAYVTPVPENWKTKEEMTGKTERDWQRVRRAVINHFG